MTSIHEALEALDEHVHSLPLKETNALKEEEQTIGKLWRRANSILWAYGSPQNPILVARRDTEKIPFTIREGLDITLRLTGINAPDRLTNSSELVVCWAGNQYVENTFFVLTENSAMIQYGYRLDEITPKHLEAMNHVLEYIEKGCVTEAARPSPSPTS